MKLSEPTIAEALARYQREYDRYLKLSSRVADVPRYEVVEANAIRAQVLVLLLPKVAQHILSNHPTGRGVGGPTRISGFAARYLDGGATSVATASSSQGAQ
jgi:hypothetical protein